MISDAEIQRIANEASYRRGCSYQRNGAVAITRSPDGAWRRSLEIHRERCHTREELTAWLHEAGFGKIRIYGDRKMRRPAAGEQRVYYSCVRL